MEKDIYKFRELKIHDEFSQLIPKLSPIIFEELKADILQRGILDPLLVWNGYIIDGHHRYEIAKSQDPPLPFYITEIKGLDTESDVIKWMIRHQVSRRNISCFAKAELALKYVEELKKHDPLGELADREKLYKNLFDISKETVYRVSFILKFGNEKLINAARDEENNVFTSYKKVQYYKKVSKKPIIKLKDAEILGHYSNIDAIKFVKTEIKRHHINCVITEPPQPNSPELIKRFEKNSGLRKGYALAVFENVMKALFDPLNPSSDLFIIIDPIYVIEYTSILKEFFNIKYFLTWDFRKSKETLNPKAIQNRHKTIIWAYKGLEKPLVTNMADVFEERFDPNYPLDTIPESLVKKLISLVENENTVVFDPFAGYGSVVRAALDTRTTVYACEINSEIYEQGYIQLAKRRTEV